ncbi:MAG: hypothetical protein R3A11_07155 [Bdellovibrionota bacterium]
MRNQKDIFECLTQLKDLARDVQDREQDFDQLMNNAKQAMQVYQQAMEMVSKPSFRAVQVSFDDTGRLETEPYASDPLQSSST